MKYALERLDNIIEAVLNRHYIEQFTTEEEMVTTSIETVVMELAQVKTWLSRCSTKYTTEKALELLIQQYQAELILLLDKAYSYDTGTTACRQVMKLLDEMLTHIERRYTKYFNLEMQVPEVYLQLTQEEAGQQCKKLQKAGRFRNIDAELLQLTLDPLQLFSKNKWGASITYRGMLYIKELLNELRQTENPLKTTYPEKDLILLLAYLNFNTPEMITQVVAVILHEVNKLLDATAREERLLQWQKELNQCQVKPGMAAISGYTTLKEQVGNWLMEELQYFEKRQQRLFVEPTWQPAPLTGIEMIAVNLPVQCLGILLRSATEEGLLMGESVESAIKKASQFFTTPGTRNKKGVSGGSMRNKSYKPTKEEKARVIGPLYGMIRRIGNY